MKTYSQTVEERISRLRSVMVKKAAGQEVETFVPTGLRDWDARGGLERGILTVIGAATGEGKSVVKLHLAMEAAKRGMRVLMVDFEDPGGKTADRTLASLTGLDNRRIGNAGIDAFEFEMLEASLPRIKEWGDRIVHHTGLVGTEECLGLMRAEKWDLILVDYAQAFPEDEGSSMERTISRFAWEANAIAQKLDAAVVVFSQIKREVEDRGYARYEQWKTWGSRTSPNKPDVSGFAPTGLTDLAWAKGLGDRAKAILYLWRPGRIAKKLGHNVKDDRMKVIGGKVNFGSEEDLEFKFDGATAAISDLGAP